MTGPAPTAGDRDLLEAAREAADRAYAPYSRFHVGAAALAADGRIHVGANMENASYGLSLCAEVQALMAASFAGGDVVAVAVAGHAADAPNAPGDIVTPCGRCRQLIHEAACRAGRPVRVVCANGTLEAVSVATSDDLLPHGFGPHALPENRTPSHG